MPFPELGVEYEAPRFHHATQQRGDGMAARGARPKLIAVDRFLSSGDAATSRPFAAGFRKGLLEEDFAEGQHLSIEYRWGEGPLARVRATHKVNAGPPMRFWRDPSRWRATP